MFKEIVIERATSSTMENYQYKNEFMRIPVPTEADWPMAVKDAATIIKAQNLIEKYQLLADNARNSDYRSEYTAFTLIKDVISLEDD